MQMCPVNNSTTKSRIILNKTEKQINVTLLLFYTRKMIIYNITIKVDWSIAEDWLEWMQNTHIPEVLGSGCFDRHQMVRLLQVDETEGPTYAAQYYAPTLSRYDYYLQHFAPAHRKQITEKWGEKYIDFHSLMQVVG